MTAVDKSSSERGAVATPALWGEAAPQQFDRLVPWWVKLLVVAALTIFLGIFFVDQPLAAWARAHPIPDLGYRGDPGDARLSGAMQGGS